VFVSGKRNSLNVLMGNLMACGDVVIWAIDLKREMEPQAQRIRKFLLSAPEYDSPKRASCYEVSDQDVTDTAAHYAVTGLIWMRYPSGR
jgi:hypothetical protein